MSDDSKFSYSFELSGTEPPAAPELFAVEDFTTLPLAQGVLVVNKVTGATLAVQTGQHF